MHQLVSENRLIAIEAHMTTPCAATVAHFAYRMTSLSKCGWIMHRGENGNEHLNPIGYGGPVLSLDTLQTYAGKEAYIPT